MLSLQDFECACICAICCSEFQVINSKSWDTWLEFHGWFFCVFFLFHWGKQVSIEKAEKASSFLSSSYWRRLSGAHRRAVMWFHCLRPCGRVPSGGKPLRLCWHITAPIINSRSALSFLLQLSSFLLTAVLLLPCSRSHLCSRFIHSQRFSSNLLSQQSYVF